MNTRTLQQELNFLREMNRMIRTNLEAFAYAAAVTVRRGHVYRYAQEIGVSPLEITTALGRDLQDLKRAGDLADTYGQPDTIEFRHAAWLALSCHGLRMEAVVAAIESDKSILKVLGPSGRFARAFVEWRQRVAAGEPPPVESIACQLGHFLGQEVDKYNVHDIIRDLGEAMALDGDRDRLGDVVAGHRGALVAPEFCRVIAEDALGAAVRPASGTVPAAVCQEPSPSGGQQGDIIHGRSV